MEDPMQSPFKTKYIWGYFRQDEDSHWYLIPEKYIKLFIKQKDDIACTIDFEKRENLVEEFIQNFDEYRLSGGIESYKVMMKEK